MESKLPQNSQKARESTRAAEAQRQSTLANNSRYAALDQAWVDAMSVGALG